MNFRAPATLRAAIEQIARIRRDARLVLWSLIVILTPFYFFDSGRPQVADMLGLILLVVVVKSWNGRLPPRLGKQLVALLMFIGYVILLNVGWSLVEFKFSINAKVGFLIAPTFYIFNGLILFVFLLMFQAFGEFFLWLTARLVLIAAVFQAVLALLSRAAVGRATAMFNNSNQLGYYALLSACIILVSHKRLRLSTLQVTTGLAASSFLALLSASKAALGSVAALGLVLLVTKIRTMLVVGLVFAALIFTSNPFSRAIDNAQQRIESDESFGFIEERGYDRIYEYPQYLIAGAGEGAYNRFRETSLIGAHELHSSMGTLVFCYGVVGVSLFGFFMWRTMKGTGFRAWLIVGTGFAYSMTHQGLRFRLLWVLLGMVAALREVQLRERQAKRAASIAARAAQLAAARAPAKPAPEMS